MLLGNYENFTNVVAENIIVSPVRSTYGGYYGFSRRYAAAAASADTSSFSR